MDTLSKKKLFAYLIVDDIEVKEEVFNKAKNGDGAALGTIGDIYFHKKEYTKAMSWYRLSAAENDANSQCQMGYMYNNGKGISVNHKLAMEWYLKSRNNGSARATHNIGYMHDHGLGVKQDYKIALTWFLETANKGYAESQYTVGIYYQNGYSVKKDLLCALEWFEKSARQGEQKAKNEIKSMDEQGIRIGDAQKRYIQLEKEMIARKSDMELLEMKLKLTQDKLKTSQQEKKKKDNDIKLLKEEIQIQKLNIWIDMKEQLKSKLNEDNIHQLEHSISNLIIGSNIPNAANNSRINEDDLEKDLCYN